MNLLSQSKNATILPVLIALTFACFALSPAARAVCQEGCLTNQNTVLGDDALFNNTTGSDNTAIGFRALFNNATGFNNTATGVLALNVNTIGTHNTAIGALALLSNTTGSANSAVGDGALTGNTTGGNNTAIGFDALENNTTGSNNTAIGIEALVNNTTGSDNIALGSTAGRLTTGNNNIDIGNTGNPGESNTIRIGRRGVHNTTAIAGIRGAAISGGITVMIDANGRLGTTTSSKRFKEAIKSMDKASEAILALKPVTFHYKQEIDPDGIPQFGLVAEEVEKVNPDLVARDADGKAYTVRYEAVNAMLLNEFLKEHKKVEQLQATVTQQQKDFQTAIATLKQTVTAQLNGQAAQIQKLSAQLEMSKAAPQMVKNP